VSGPAAGDAQLRQFERDGVAACLVVATIAAAATLLAGQGVWSVLEAGLGVVAGGLLMAFSYRAIKGGVDVLVASVASAPPAAPPPEELPPGDPREEAASEGDSGPPPPPALSAGRRLFLAVKFFTRYALLALAAYVMLTCFRLHPVSVVAGAMAPFLAALMQVGRMSRARARRSHP
jgi:hypothetical protein